MSRVGRKPIAFPPGVTAQVADGVVSVKGPKGEMQHRLPERISAQVQENTLVVSRASDQKADRALHGLTRSLIGNMIAGVSAGFTKTLDVVGIGYRASVEGQTLVLSLGYSHPVRYPLPEGVTASVEKNRVTVRGIDRQRVGQTAAAIRRLRPPEPYKGKGIRFTGEVIRRKEGKTGK